MLWHYLSSNSRHGTHSPFVYKLADEVIYRPLVKGGGEYKQRPVACLMQEIAFYYSTTIVTSPGTEKDNTILLLDVREVEVDAITIFQKKHTMLFLKDIYKSKASKKKWSALLADHRIIVTIDLFYFGIVIYRNEQPKAHYKLRFPFGKY